MAVMAKKVPHLVQKGHSYYFRIRVPKALEATYGRLEVTQPLGRLSQPQAAIKARELAAHYAAQFQTQLHELGLEPTAPVVPALPKRMPTLEEVTHIGRDGARELLRNDELARAAGINTPAGDAWSDLLSDLDHDVAQAVSGAKVSQLFERFRADVAGHGLQAPKDTEELRPMVYRWATEYAKVLQQAQQRVKGLPVDTPAPEAPPASLTAHKDATTDPSKMTGEQLRMRDVLELWKAHETNRPPKTVGKAELAVKRFEAMTGDPALGTLTRADGAEYRKKLLGSEMSTHAANAQLTWIHVFLNFEANNHQRILANPWKGLTIVSNDQTVREEWKDTQVVQLFGLPLFQRYELPKVKNAGLDAAYWVPIIGAYTGARATEIAQLLVDDILSVDGLQCIRIAVTEAAWQRLKGGPNGPSRRTIPVHAELVRLGLVEYAAAMRKLGASRLFPALVVSDTNNAGGGISKWFSDFKGAAGFGPENTFHGWRNTIETKLQRVREGQLYIDRYVGHKPEGMGAGTYARVQPSDFVETVAKIGYDGLTLPRVYKVPAWRP